MLPLANVIFSLLGPGLPWWVGFGQFWICLDPLYHFAPIQANAKRIAVEILYRTPNYLPPLHMQKRKPEYNVEFDS